VTISVESEARAVSVRTAPLTGVRVLELGHIVAGPTASMILAKLGADVIKVERPGSGDQSRLSRGDQGYFLAFNGRKRSITLDLGRPQGRAVFARLLKTADMVLDNFGPGVLERMGLSYAEMAKINPAILHCGIKGFLPGPYEHRNLLDEPAQMMGGLAYMTGPPGMPRMFASVYLKPPYSWCHSISRRREFPARFRRR
jgi:crotonobetainyl-CoA:carnitine CoA-transferase CaiB-like acyl-CoA transferase